MLLNALVPDGTASVLLGHLQDVPDSNRQRIAALEQQGDWQGLAKFAEENIAKDPFSSGWRLIAGYAHAQLRDYPQAIAHFNELVRLSPDDATGYQLLAGAQRAAGQPERALTTLERAQRVVRESAPTDYLLGEVNGDLGRHRAAAAAYRRAVAIDPRLADAWFGLGRSALLLGNNEDVREAVAALEQMDAPRAAQLKAMAEAPK